MDPLQVIVDLTAAVICFSGNCHPALVGNTTPVGVFHMTRYATTANGYGGDLLVFYEDGDNVWAIHRVLDIAGQHRKERLSGDDPAQRENITLGCVNVDPVVYEELVDCCTDRELVIVVTR